MIRTDIIQNLLAYTDEELVKLIIDVKKEQYDYFKTKTNRFGSYKKLPPIEIDSLVEQIKAIKDETTKLEKKYGFKKNEILNQLAQLIS